MIQTRARSGTIVVCVLVCLLVASTMVAATTQSALRARGDVRLQLQMRQNELLLDAGVLRAARQLQASQDYRGETWRPIAAIERFDNARVEIRVTADNEDKAFRRIEVIASLGFPVAGDAPSRMSTTRRTHTFRTQASNLFPNSESPNAE